LAYEAYTHFTSPIRRYPDLLVHRAIKAVVQKKVYNPGKWEALGTHCSMTERRADDATRDVEQWLKCYFMQDKIGEEFEGTIAGVTNFGIFVALDGVYVEGLVHVTELGNDYYQFDQARHALIGERHASSLSLVRSFARQSRPRRSRNRAHRLYFAGRERSTGARVIEQKAGQEAGQEAAQKIKHEHRIHLRLSCRAKPPA